MQDIVLEQLVKVPFFSNDGTYTIIEGATIETGKYFVDTRPALQSGIESEWESMFRVQPDSKLVKPDESLPYAYTSVGEVLRLWEYARDPIGDHAKRVHNKIVELVQRGIPVTELLDEVRLVIAECLGELET